MKHSILCHVEQTFTKKTRKKQVSTMAFCYQLLLLPRTAASRYAVLLPLLPLLDQRQ
jgi:hypothetical protein